MWQYLASIPSRLATGSPHGNCPTDGTHSSGTDLPTDTAPPVQDDLMHGVGTVAVPTDLLHSSSHLPSSTPIREHVATPVHVEGSAAADTTSLHGSTDDISCAPDSRVVTACTETVRGIAMNISERIMVTTSRPEITELTIMPLSRATVPAPVSLKHGLVPAMRSPIAEQLLASPGTALLVIDRIEALCMAALHAVNRRIAVSTCWQRLPDRQSTFAQDRLPTHMDGPTLSPGKTVVHIDTQVVTMWTPPLGLSSYIVVVCITSAEEKQVQAIQLARSAFAALLKEETFAASGDPRKLLRVSTALCTRIVPLSCTFQKLDSKPATCGFLGTVDWDNASDTSSASDEDEFRTRTLVDEAHSYAGQDTVVVTDNGYRALANFNHAIERLSTATSLTSANDICSCYVEANLTWSYTTPSVFDDAITLSINL